MKLLNQPQRSIRPVTEDFTHIFGGIEDIAQIVAKILQESSVPSRAYGVEWTVDGLDYECTEGVIIYQGKHYKVDAFQGTATGSEVPVFNIVKTPLAHEPHDEFEGFQKVGDFTWTEEEKLVPTFGARGTGEFDFDVVINNPVKRNSDAIANFQGLKSGMIVDYYGSLANFDASGLGIGDMVGFALCNGKKHGNIQTPDLRGRVIVGKADSALANGNPEANLSEYFEIGNIGGERETTLTEAQLPTHTPTGILASKAVDVDILKDGVSISQDFVKTTSTDTGGGGNVQAFDWGLLDDGTNDFQVNAELNNDALTMDSIGGDEAHDNRMPFMVLGKIMKL
ncbi:hypothetical protein [Algivirga pacifica]|uniref:Uncharacterized protein n=1 Tax=Algivirga pacifica TaxID=1162670 RepID=A0ABP9D2R1_9BACT